MRKPQHAQITLGAMQTKQRFTTNQSDSMSDDMDDNIEEFVMQVETHADKPDDCYVTPQASMPTTET